MGIVLNVGKSKYWSGFTHGSHRDYEILATGHAPALPSGPKEGRSPVPAENGRLPR
ncbi:MAG: hypothetical protein NVS2B4_19880 [Ramlibacter sp.]